MFKEYFVLLLLAHIISDFYFQTGKMSKKKEQSFKWVLIHVCLYWLVTMIVLLPMFSTKVFLLGIVAAVCHAVIDVAKHNYAKKINSNRETFYVDQIMHIICILTISYFAVLDGVGLQVHQFANSFFEIIGIDKMSFVCWLLAVLIIYKPANIIISKKLVKYKPEGKDSDVDKDRKAGRVIGTLERVIILIFISINQFAAIGLVLTAKSIARYDKISKEKDFAEYYLLGTLISTVIVIIVSFII